MLANLPRTRPQRSSPRRAAARAGERAESTAANGGASAIQIAAPRPRARRRRRRSATIADGETRAGEREGERREAAHAACAAPHRSPRIPSRSRVSSATATAPAGLSQPPGGSELVASAAEILGELTKTGLATRRAPAKDVLGRLPFS